MISYTKTRRVQRSAATAFDVIGTHVFENHPKWEPEVLEIRRLDPNPVRIGSRAVMVRTERGKVSETEYVITEFVPTSRIAFDHPGSALGFSISTTITPITGTSCDITTHVTMRPSGWVRLLTPLLHLGTSRRGDRLTAAQAHVVEQTPPFETAEPAPRESDVHADVNRCVE